MARVDVWAATDGIAHNDGSDEFLKTDQRFAGEKFAALISDQCSPFIMAARAPALFQCTLSFTAQRRAS
jgi:hypothetical protein